jgi:hypothetical protein
MQVSMQVGMQVSSVITGPHAARNTDVKCTALANNQVFAKRSQTKLNDTFWLHGELFIVTLFEMDRQR